MHIESSPPATSDHLEINVRCSKAPEQRESLENQKALHLRLLDDKLNRPSFQALFDIIRTSPALKEKWSQLYERRAELLNPNLDYDAPFSLSKSPYRRVSALLVALCLAAQERTLRPLLEHAIDTEATRDSEQLKRVLFNGTSHCIPIAVTGAGLHGAIFNAEYVSNDPAAMAITFDRRRILGGQFRSYGAPVIRANTASTAVRQDREGSYDVEDFNNLGKNAPIQLAEITGDLYPTNADLGLVIALNQYLTGMSALGVDVVSREIIDDDGTQAVTLRDTETGETATHSARKLALLTGLGRDKIGFQQPDEETQSALNQNKALDPISKFYFTYQELLSTLGHQSDGFKRELFKDKDVIIQGSGHSALTVVENIVGLFSAGDDLWVSSLGGPRSITIIGSKALTAEQFQAEEFHRYSAVAALFPQDPSDTGALITPISGAYAHQMRNQQNGKIAVLYGPKSLGRNPDPNLLSQAEGDVLISTVGFDSDVASILGPDQKLSMVVTRLPALETDPHRCIPCSPEQIHLFIRESLQIPGCQYRDESGRSFMIKVISESSWSICECTPIGEILTSSTPIDHTTLLTLLHSERPPVRIEFPEWKGDVSLLPPFLCPKGTVIGRYGLGCSTIIGGPAAAVLTDEEDRARSRQIGSPMNSVSISVTGRDTREIASQLFREVGDEQATFELPGRNVTPLQSPPEATISSSASDRTILHYCLLRVHSQHKDLLGLEGLSIELIRNEDSTYAVTPSRPLNSSEEEYIGYVCNDPLMKVLLDRGYDSLECPLSRELIMRAAASL